MKARKKRGLRFAAVGCMLAFCKVQLISTPSNRTYKTIKKEFLNSWTSAETTAEYQLKQQHTIDGCLNGYVCVFMWLMFLPSWLLPISDLLSICCKELSGWFQQDVENDFKSADKAETHKKSQDSSNVPDEVIDSSPGKEKLNLKREVLTIIITSFFCFMLCFWRPHLKSINESQPKYKLEHTFTSSGLCWPWLEWTDECLRKITSKQLWQAWHT